MAHTIVLPNEFDIEKISFLPPKKNKLGGQSVLLNYSSAPDTSGAFIMQTCRVRLPFGVDKNVNEKTGEVKYHLSMSMANDETQNEILKTFTSNVRAIDNKAKTCPKESESWFGEKLEDGFISRAYKSAEKFPKDPKWPSTLKIKLPFDRKGTPQFVVYDENKKPVNILDSEGNLDPNSIPKGSEAVLLVQSTGVWFIGGTQFGVGYKLLQAKLYKSNKLSGYSIVDSEVDEEDEESDNTE